MKKVLICVGTRPNLIKITKFHKVAKQYQNLSFHLLHTGQHFDYKMSDIFFEQLGIPQPDHIFTLETSTQVEKIAEIMVKFEKYVEELKPDLVLVPGDVNSSMACGIVASRLGIPVGHIESGLRSFDRTMPEEINRLLIDELSDLFFVTEPSGLKHLHAEGKPKEKIHHVGNTMIDSLIQFEPVFEKSKVLEENGLEKGNYFVFTFHRPGNVDDPVKLKSLVNLILKIAENKKVIFPVHPRTKNNLEQNNLYQKLDHPNIVLGGPLGYIDFMKLISNSIGVITDSGGIQEETTFMQVPCLTIRPNTERPVTSDIGSNTLLPLDEKIIFNEVKSILEGTYKKGEIPEFWDGNATDRIVKVINDYLIESN
jgi:UDP-N-acetylglucosamine 2-epimerase (non-hydrolysing)